MFKKLLGKTLAELPANERALILMPIIAVVVLASVIIVLWTKLGHSSDAELKAKDLQIEFWQKQSVVKDHTIELKDHKIDSMINKAYNDKVETNTKLQLIIDRQNNQKTLLRKMK